VIAKEVFSDLIDKQKNQDFLDYLYQKSCKNCLSRHEGKNFCTHCGYTENKNLQKTRKRVKEFCVYCGKKNILQ